MVQFFFSQILLTTFRNEMLYNDWVIIKALLIVSLLSNVIQIITYYLTFLYFILEEPSN